MNGTRLEIRLRSEAKELIQQAAGLRNQSLTQFVLATLTEGAEKVVAEYQQRVLSDRDRDLFLRLLDDPPAPNAKLRRAAASHRKNVAQ